MNINIEDIQTYYKYFIEHISYAHGYLSELIKITNTFLSDCTKNIGYDELLCTKAEENLLYFELFYKNLDEIFDYVDNITFPIIKRGKSQNIQI